MDCSRIQWIVLCPLCNRNPLFLRAFKVDIGQAAAAIERWKKAASHPDEADLAAAAQMVANMERKLVMRKRYLAKKQKRCVKPDC